MLNDELRLNTEEVLSDILNNFKISIKVIPKLKSYGTDGVIALFKAGRKSILFKL